MSWTAPDVSRPSTLTIGAEREILQSWLDFHRLTLLHKCAGLTSEQLKQASAAPSNLTLLGLVRHMADVERWWFRRHSAGQADVGFLYWVEGGGDPEFEEVAGADAEKDYRAYLDEIRLCDEAVAGLPLEHTFTHRSSGAEMSLRWAYVHMIEEYARHNGHADIIRERVDGAVGD